MLAAIDEMGYRPNRLARNLRRQKAEMIGVVVADIENPHFTEMVRVVEDAAYRQGYRVLLCNTDENEDKQRAYLEVLAAERVMGVILSPTNPSGREIGHLLDLGIPVVAFDRPVTDSRADSVVTDNVSAGRMATEHLLGAGHTRIGCISCPEVETGIGRLKGYEAAMRAAGLATYALSGHSRIEGGVDAAAQLLRENSDLTALVVSNNLMTIGALKTLRAYGLRVPHEVAIVSIDDPFWSEIAEPPLTTLAQPIRRMAESVFTLLVERHNSHIDQARHLVFDFELCVRASSGTARTTLARAELSSPQL